jgi:hypothetical protein
VKFHIYARNYCIEHVVHDIVVSIVGLFAGDNLYRLRFLVLSGHLGKDTDSSLKESCNSLSHILSSPIKVIGFFSCPNSSCRIMAVGSTQPLTGMSTRNLPRVKGGRCI